MPAIILIHGFTGSPYELEGFAEQLNHAGFTVLRSKLAGHGTTPADLNKQKETDWIKGLVAEYQQLSARYNTIYIVGISFGGVVALEAIRRKLIDPKGIITISTPVFMPKEKSQKWVVPILRYLKRSVKKSWVKPEDYGKYEEWKVYTKIPLHALYYSNKLTVMVRERLNEISLPIMIIHSKKDPVVDSLNAEYLYNRIGSSNKILELTEEPNHSIWKVNTVQIVEKIMQFIKTT